MKRLFHCFILYVSWLPVILMLFGNPCLALTVDSVYPSLGETNKSLDVAITGEAFTPSSRASISLDTLNRMKIIGDADVLTSIHGYTCSGGSANEVSVSGNTAYITRTCEYYNSAEGETYKSGILQLLDMTDPTSPKNITYLELFNELRPADYNGNPFYYTSVYGVAVRGNYAYVATGKFGLTVIDVSDTTNPQVINTLDTNGTVLDIDLMGNYALLAQSDSSKASTNGLVVVDIGTVTGESVVSSIQLKNCAKVTAGNSMAYVSEEFFDGIYGITVVDLKNINAPNKKGSIITQNEPQGLASDGQIVYMAVGQSGFQVVDADNADSPELIGSLVTPSYCTHVAIDSERMVAYLGLTDGRILIVDVSDSTQPHLLGTVAVPVQSPQLTGLAFSGRLVYALDESSDKVNVIDASSPAPLTILGSGAIEGTPSNIEVAGNKAYVTVSLESDQNYGALLKYDISDPKNPVFQKSVYLDAHPLDMVILSNKAYILSDYKLQLVNLDTMAAPQEIALALTGGDRASVLDVAGSKAFIATAFEDLAVVDIDTLSQVTLYSLPRDNTVYTTSITVENGIAYITKYDMQIVVFSIVYIGYLHAVDVSNPDSPVSLDSLHVPDLLIPQDVVVNGSRAYIADGLSDLLVFNVAEPDNLSYIGKKWTSEDSTLTDFCGRNNQTLYTLSKPDGLLMFSTVDPSNPVLIGSTGLRGWPREAKVLNGNVFAVDYNYGLTVAPLPVETPVLFESPSLIKATLPVPAVKGNYTVRVFDDTNGSQLAGAVTYTDEIKLLTSKAIIVAGGGPNSGNNIWNETKAYANQAYDNLIYQGYKHQDIYYLTDQYQPLHDRYDPQLIAQYANVKAATRDNLEYAIKTWAKSGGTSDLLIFMEDHGEKERFLLRGGSNPQYVTAEELDSWLDNLQNSFPGKVIFLYDACYSGSFITRLTPPAGKTRLVLTSSTPDQVTYFLAPDHSFSSHFWSTFSGKTGNMAIMSDALERAASEMAAYQTAQIDVDGDGVPNQSSDYTDLEEYEGTIYALRRQYYYRDRTKPVIGAVTGNKTLPGDSSILSAESVYDLDGDTIARVWAEVVPPDFNPDITGRTVVSIPDTQLFDPDLDGRYQITYSGFNKHGTYIISYYAEDSSGIYSLPRTSLVRQNGGTLVVVPDEYEIDDTYAGANVIVVNDPSPQNHSFHTADDVDWVKFYGNGGVTYTITASQPTIISDPVINIYGPKGYASTGHNKGGMGDDETLSWKCPADGLYFIKMTNNSSHYGANVRYKLKMYTPIAFSLPGYVKGKVTSGGQGIAGAVIRGGGGTAVSQGNGSYLMSLPAGNYSVSVSKAGYSSNSFSVSVPSGGSTTRNVALTANVVNAAPTINGSPLATAYTYEWYSFEPVAADPNGDKLIFSITGTPEWADFNTNTGILSGLPTLVHTGSYGPYTISISDGKLSASLPPFTINVIEGSNLPPTIGGSPQELAGIDRLYSFSPQYSDPNGDSLTLTISGKPEWATFSGGRLFGVPGKNNLWKKYGPISIRVKDPKGAYAVMPSFFIQVVPNRYIDKFGILPGVFLLLQEN